MSVSLSDGIGLIGTAIVVVVYFLNIRGSMPSEGWLYSLLNLVGAGLIFVSLLRAWNFSAAAIEIFWGAISIYGLVRAGLHRPR